MDDIVAEAIRQYADGLIDEESLGQILNQNPPTPYRLAWMPDGQQCAHGLGEEIARRIRQIS